MQGLTSRRLQYKNSNRKELVFNDGTFVIYEILPADHMRLFNKDLYVEFAKRDENGNIILGYLVYKTFQIASICENKILSWNINPISNKIFEFPVIE